MNKNNFINNSKILSIIAIQSFFQINLFYRNSNNTN